MIGSATSDWAEIIKAAASSPLGILALSILILFALALKFFAKDGPWIRVFIFTLLFVGVVGLAIVILPKVAEHPGYAQNPSPTPEVAIPSASISAMPTKEGLARTTLQAATKDHPWVNSLGMKFVPVAGIKVLFSVWDTRAQDFEAFVKSTGYDATEGVYSLGKDGWKQRGATWREPGFEQDRKYPYPVVGVSWEDAEKFCEWLTEHERGSEGLPAGVHYRLPTDEEWSVAVGLDSEHANTPREKDSKKELYPWGPEWPPPSGAGNYWGEESQIGDEPKDLLPIKDYNDGYPRTSPVWKFGPNKSGLYDMGGNVWQWCEGWYNSENKAENKGHVLRGASWSNFNKLDLLASNRRFRDLTPFYRSADIGFRCVVAVEPSR
jgi:formylglycine-generating enzyme required for sulfatase activity